MMKITLLKKANLFRAKSTYALFRDEREIGQLTDTGLGDLVEIALDGKAWRIERTRAGIATGRLSGIRNLLSRNATGEFHLVDAAGAELATARQPMLYQFIITAGPVTLDVPGGKGQKTAKLHVMNEQGEAIGELSQAPWKITGRTDWFSSLPSNTDPLLEIFALYLYVMSEQIVEKSTSYSN
jgi:hypothetical protein